MGVGLSTNAKHEKHVHAVDTGAPYLTPCQLAGILQTSDATVYRWAADKTMPVLRVGDVVRFPRERVFAWLRSREQGRGRPKVRRLDATPGAVASRFARDGHRGDTSKLTEPATGEASA